MRRILLGVALAAAACRSVVDPLEIPPGHPASSDAPEAPAPELRGPASPALSPAPAAEPAATPMRPMPGGRR